MFENLQHSQLRQLQPLIYQQKDYLMNNDSAAGVGEVTLVTFKNTMNQKIE